MRVERGYKTDTASGDRQIIFCEGTRDSIDIIFYTTILGINKDDFMLKPLGSSNTLFCYADIALFEDGICLMDRDFKTDDEIKELETKYKIKFLRVHEVENFLLDVNYLKKLDYIKQDIDIDSIIKDTISENKNRLLADYLQHKINNYLNGSDYKFPRIGQLKSHEITDEDEIVKNLLYKLNQNYQKIEHKIKDIENNNINKWKNEFNTLSLELLPGKEILQKIKNKIFNNPPPESDIAKDMASLMCINGYMPECLHNVFFGINS